MYIGIGNEQGNNVTEEDAFLYAMERLRTDTDLQIEFAETIVPWFFSGDFIKKEDLKIG